VDQSEWLAGRFEEHRPHLRGVAYRMLGSLPEAEDAVQESWLRLSRTDANGIENLTAWLTTVVARVCLNMLQARKTRREEPLDTRVPDPIIAPEDRIDPEHQALLADSIGLALQVVLEVLTPAERVAFVLHDMFAVPFEDIGPIVGKSPQAARQLASRARRRVQGAAMPDTDLASQRKVVDAFHAAARDGDFEALVAVLDPDVVLRADAGVRGPASTVVRGAAAVASGAIRFTGLSAHLRPALVNGAAGVVAVQDGSPISVAGFTVRGGKIIEIDILADPERLRQLQLTFLGH
jgi:RNA polymerase sigma-70 factor (ECF subfamily)